MIRSKDIHQRLRDIEEFLLDEYKESRVEKERDWRTYEQRLMHRIKEAVRNLEPLIEEAVESIEVHKSQGRKPKLDLKQKVVLLLLKQLFAKSNRMMSSMLAVFSLLSGVDVSYKTIERLYSDPEVEMAIHNLHALLLEKKGVRSVNGSGDGTGYSLTIKKHYATETKKRKNKAKESKGKEKKMAFVYSFKIMDLKSRMYVCYGTSMRSEKEAFDKAVDMLEEIDLKIETMRLDKYYSYP
ncbi:MAG: ISNCY family transposase, partial [Candidatus Hydrothermarchaeaceae archaeon]